jgi:2'-5' RNA ligase
MAPNGARGTGTRPDGTLWGTGFALDDPRSDPAYDQYTAELDEKLDQALAEIGDTETIYDKVDGVPGAYRPEREAVHEALLDELMAGFKDVPRENKAIVMAGPPGAGKSTVIKTDGKTFGVEVGEDGAPSNYAVVNPDDMKELIVSKGLLPPDYPGRGIGDGESATFMHEESSHLANRLLTRLKAEGVNVILDGTFSGNPDKQAGKVHTLRGDGYTVTGVLVDGSVDRSLSNAARRHRKPPTEPGGAYSGRYVPYGLIETNRPSSDAVPSEVFGRPHRNKASENIERVQSAFDGGVLWYDNATGRSTLVHRVGPGQEARAGTDVAKSLAADPEGKSWGELALERIGLAPETKAEGGTDRNRGGAERLRRYWTHGEGAAKIRWGTPGDHDRCVRLVVEHAEFTEEQAHGYCNLREKEATGQYPAQHAARSKALRDALGLPVILLDELVKAAPAPSTDGGAIPNTSDVPDGVMVALYPPDDLAQALHLDADGAEDVSTLHVTLAYLGGTDDVGMERVGDLVELVRGFAAESFDVPAEIAGLGRWGAGDDGDALVALVDAPDLADFRADLVDALEEGGFEVRKDHGFTPHVTLAYLDPAEPSPLERIENLPGTFGWLSVAFGPDVWDFPLAADDTPAADPAGA